MACAEIPKCERKSNFTREQCDMDVTFVHAFRNQCSSVRQPGFQSEEDELLAQLEHEWKRHMVLESEEVVAQCSKKALKSSRKAKKGKGKGGKQP